MTGGGARTGGLVLERRSGASITVTDRHGAVLVVTLLCADAGRAKLCFAGGREEFKVLRAEMAPEAEA